METGAHALGRNRSMMTAVRVFLGLSLAAGALALVLGLGLWWGVFAGLLTWHMGLGLTLVVSLWVLAALAWRRTRRIGPSALAIVWSIAVVALGVTQGRLLPGSAHWIVQVAHLLSAGVTIGLARALSAAARK
jgi:hypothetical protein